MNFLHPYYISNPLHKRRVIFSGDKHLPQEAAQQAAMRSGGSRLRVSSNP